MPRFFVLLIFLVLCGEYAQAQAKNYQFLKYGVEDGLSQAQVHNINQDSSGYIWINTLNGLNRFNGSEFNQIFPSEDTLTVSLPHQRTYDLLEDRNGMLWIGTRNGLSKYDPRLQKFTNFTEVGNCEGCLVGMLVRRLLEDPPYIWIGTSAGLSRIHSVTHEIDSWYYTDGTDNVTQLFSIRDMELLDNGEILMATDEGLAIYSPENDHFRYFSEENGLFENFVETLERDSNGQFWMGYRKNTIARVTGDWTDPRFEHFQLTLPDGSLVNSINDIVEYELGEMWICTESGIIILDTENNTKQVLQQEEGNTYGISTNNIQNMFVDADKRIWLGSDQGIDMFDPYLNQFELLQHIDGNTSSISSNNTTAIFEDSYGCIWIGSNENGVTVICNPENERIFTHISANSSMRSLASPIITAIAEDHNRKIWVATSAGLNIIDWPDRQGQNYQVSKFPSGAIEARKLPASLIHSIQKDENNTMWLSTNGKGLLSVNTKGEIRQYTYRDSVHGLLSRNFINTVGLDADSKIWIGVHTVGPCILNDHRKDSAFTKMKGGSILRDSPAHDFSISGESIMIATPDGAFYFADKESLLDSLNIEYIRFNKDMGLSDNTVNKIIAVQNDEFWLSTGNGISRVDIKKRKASSYRKIIGARNFQFNQGSGVLTRDSLIYFGGQKGVLRFDPNTFQTNAVPPKVRLDNFKILNRNIPVSEDNDKVRSLPKAIAYMERITLQPQDKIISFKIDAINYTLPEEMEFAFKLVGFKDEWNYSDQAIITYTNLDPGSYTLLAKAANNEGVWGEPVKLEIVMQPPWWQTWWAISIYLIIIIIIAYLLLKVRLARERKLEQVRLEERESFRKRSYRDFHDEAGTKITRISLITELAKGSNKDNEQIQEYLSQIEDNLQDLNTGMRDFIWTLDPTKDNVYDTLVRFTEFAGKFCEYGEIQFRSDDIPEKLKEKTLNISQRRHLLLILKEALNNSVKHGKPTIVAFKVQIKQKKLILALQDNGSGFDTSATTSGNGLNNMKERAEALAADLRIKSEVNKGTTLHLSLETTHTGDS